MGNILSVVWSGRALPTTRVGETMDLPNESENEEFLDPINQDEDRVKAKEQEMEEFKKQLNAKREQRKEILARHRNEKKELEASLEDERKAKLEAYETNRQLRELLTKNNIDIPETLISSKEDTDISDTILNMKEEFVRLRDSNVKLRRSLAETTGALQNAYSDMAELQAEHTASIRQIGALKEVVQMSKTMINLREGQLTELKNKLTEIEQSLADREASMLSADLRNEYVRQLQNIRTLRTLYEERARLAEVTKQSIVRELEEQKALKETAETKCNELKTRVEELESKVNELLDTMDNKNSQISASEAETHGLKNEMSVVNKLFSQVLLGYKNKRDLDKLVHRLEENHGLLTHMAEKENGSEASTALPKLLLELISQVDEGDDDKEAVQSTTECSEEIESTKTAAEEIVENLPKVWRVLIELLSHQSIPEESTSEKVTTCYKSVETKSGPVLVPSVSQTYIRLKDLIVEKLSLVKEVNRMKQLNTHLESRLGEQERRLCLVTTELSKTWNVVSRLRRHHHQLHTHEKILKYELHQKRKLLNELKEELEYCREKWEQAREKNIQSERDWKKLRAEFTNRKKTDKSFNQSAESGYSDERPSDESSESNDESEYVTEPLIRSKRKLKKSFENMLDSSTDCNLVAEREDPASDLLDVADLPLDNQDGDNSHDISDSCNSESLFKSERICEETEDEIGDIANDSCVEDVGESSQDHSTTGTAQACQEKAGSSDNSKPQAYVDPAAILKSIKQQNERLARKDEKLENLERSSAALLNQTKLTVKVSDQISDVLDNLISRPSSSNQESHIPSLTTAPRQHDDNLKLNISPEDPINNESSSQMTAAISLTIDPAAILESIQEQKVRLAQKDKRLETLEKSGANLLQQTQATTRVSEQINKTLDHLVNRPTSSNTHTSIDNVSNSEEIVVGGQLSESEHEVTHGQVQTSISKGINTAFVNDTAIPSNNTVQDNASPNVDFKAILNNVKIQKEMLARKDARLQTLETGCTDVVSGLVNTVTNASKIIQKLDEVHMDYQNDPNQTSLPDSSASSNETPIVVNEELSQLLDLNTEAGSATHNSAESDDGSTTHEVSTSVVDFKAILEDVREHNEMLSKKDERLQKLESSCAEVVGGLVHTLNAADDISQTLDAIHEHHLTDPKESPTHNSIDGDPSTMSNAITITDEEFVHPSTKKSNKIAKDPQSEVDDSVMQEETNIEDSDGAEDNMSITNIPEATDDSVSRDADSNKTVEKIQVCNENVPIKDPNDDKASVSETNEIPETFNHVVTASYEYENDIEQGRESRESSEPSTSSEMDHEARFAARDVRLKRLEEQTKSLVSKVNKTTSKGIKINYKLEELHNIYGSENSRAGTPSEDDISHNDGDEE